MLMEIGVAVFNTLKIMGWIGIVLFLLATVNTVCSMTYNITGKGESFSWKRLFKGIGKTGLFYGSAIFMSTAFTIVPFINEMISMIFGQMLISNDILEQLSSVAVLGICIAVILQQGKKALEGVKKLGEIKVDNEEVTWNVENE